MSKSQSDHTTNEEKNTRQTAQTAADETEQQAHHRTAVRIAGIEGIDGFVDVAEDTGTRPGS